MSPARHLPARDYKAIKAASRDLVSECGGARRASDVTGLSHQVISRCISADPENADRFLRVDIVADLEGESGRPIVTELLAELSGHVLVPAPRGTNSEAVALISRVSDMLAEVSDVSGGVAAALRDDRVTAAEARSLHTEVREAMQALAALDQQIALAVNDTSGEDR